MNESPDFFYKTWGSLFKEEIVWPDTNEDIVRAFLNHLADLGVFHTSDGKSWLTKDIGVVSFRSEIIKRLQNLCSKEEGFAVGYFLSSGFYDSSKLTLDALSNILKVKEKPEGQKFDIKKPSDLSNLQIVKNTAIRIQPFLELENKCIDKLVGQYTSRDDARKIYNYILSKTYPKEKPLKWQQLSRRRHRKD